MTIHDLCRSFVGSNNGIPYDGIRQYRRTATLVFSYIRANTVNYCVGSKVQRVKEGSILLPKNVRSSTTMCSPKHFSVSRNCDVMTVINDRKSTPELYTNTMPEIGLPYRGKFPYFFSTDRSRKILPRQGNFQWNLDW